MSTSAASQRPGGGRTGACTPRYRAALVAVLGILMLSTGGAPAWAAGLTVTVTDTEGRAVADAVVLLLPIDPAAAAAGAGPAAGDDGPAVIDQSGEMFSPQVTVVRKGGQVQFRNSDVTRHHVYSFSPAKPFELQVAPEQETAPLTFDQPGIVALGCNIHDQMVAWIYVADRGTPVRTGADGLARFGDLPEGGYRVTVWHPRLRPGTAEPVLDVTMSGGDRVETVPLRLLPQRRHNHERSAY